MEQIRVFRKLVSMAAISQSSCLGALVVWCSIAVIADIVGEIEVVRV